MENTKLTTEQRIDNCFLYAKEYGESKVQGFLDTLVVRHLGEDMYYCFSRVVGNVGRIKTKEEVRGILQEFLK